MVNKPQDGLPIKVRCIPHTLGKLTDPPEDKSLDIYILQGDATKEAIQEVLSALDQLHVACGGLGLHFEVEDETIKTAEQGES